MQAAPQNWPPGPTRADPSHTESHINARYRRVAGSGSFIRPTAPNLDFGKSFLAALVEKYIEIPLGDSNGEYVILGSSNGAIQVEAVNLDKIREKLSNLTKLRDVSLDKEGVSSADDYGAIRDRCPSTGSCLR